MASNEEIMEVEDSNGDSYGNTVKQRLKDRTKVKLFLSNTYYFLYACAEDMFF